MRFEMRIIMSVTLFLLGCGPKSCVSEVPEIQPHQPDSKASTEEITEQVTQTPDKKERLLAFLGDSLTAGYRLDISESFPSKVGARFNELAIHWKILNSGISGDTTSGALARIDWLLKAKPDAVFVCLGANDGLRGIPLKVTEDNLKAIIEKLQKEQILVFLSAMQIPDNYGKEYSNSFKNLFPTLAKQYSIPLMESFIEKIVTDKNLSLNDGIHPNSKGTSYIAEKVTNFVIPHLQKKDLE